MAKLKSELTKFVSDGKNLVIKKEAEQSLVAFLDHVDWCLEQLEQIKKDIAISGQKAIGEDFKGIFGEKIKAIYRFYGDKYKTDNPEFKKKIIIERADSGKIEDYLKEKGELPSDTQENVREGKLVIQRINEETKTIST